MTSRQSRAYRTEETLYLDALSKNPSAWAAMHNLGMLYIGRDEIELGLGYLERAHALHPSLSPEFLEGLHKMVEAKRKGGKLPIIVKRNPTEYRGSR
jgi:hypothetical protein